MCYDVSFRVKLEQLTDIFPGLVADPQLQVPWPEYDHLMGPGPNLVKLPVIFLDKEEVLRCRVMEWGVIKKDLDYEPRKEDIDYNLNIMSEKIFQKNSEWYPLRWNICFLPVTGTYEHRGIKGWRKKVPYFIRPKDQLPFFLPGLYSEVLVWDDRIKQLRKRWTFGINTREPSPENVLRSIHNSSTRGFRMASYQPREHAIELLSPNRTELTYKKVLEYEMMTEDLEYYTVDTIRGGFRKDGLPKDAPFAWNKLPALGTMNPGNDDELQLSMFG